MSTQPLQQAIAATRSVLENVQAEQMEASTPCASWNVKELVNHVIGGQAFFASAMNGEAPSADETDWSQGDILAAYDKMTAASVAAFEAEGALGRMVSLPFGDMPGAAWMGLATTDTFTHGWDLAKATGQSTDLAPELASALLDSARANIQDSFRGDEGAPFGAEQQCADDACAADQLAAFLGRQV